MWTIIILYIQRPVLTKLYLPNCTYRIYKKSLKIKFKYTRETSLSSLDQYCKEASSSLNLEINGNVKWKSS